MRSDVSALYVRADGPYPSLVADWWDEVAAPTPVRASIFGHGVLISTAEGLLTRAGLADDGALVGWVLHQCTR